MHVLTSREFGSRNQREQNMKENHCVAVGTLTVGLLLLDTFRQTEIAAGDSIYSSVKPTNYVAIICFRLILPSRCRCPAAAARRLKTIGSQYEAEKCLDYEVVVAATAYNIVFSCSKRSRCRSTRKQTNAFNASRPVQRVKMHSTAISVADGCIVIAAQNIPTPSTS